MSLERCKPTVLIVINTVIALPILWTQVLELVLFNCLFTLVIAVIVMGIGTGGFKANVSPLVAEQYKKSKLFIGHTRTGERVIVDPIMTTSRIYMYFYLFTNIGALIGQITMAYSEKVCRQSAAQIELG